MNAQADKKPLFSIGIIFGKYDLKYLEYSLESIFAQDILKGGKNQDLIEVFMHNNVIDEDSKSEDDKVIKWIKKNYPSVKISRTGNIGFGPGHNVMMRKMTGKYYFCYNPDMILEKDFLSCAKDFLDKNKNIGAVSGRLMYWDFENREKENFGKTNQVDSLGMGVSKKHRFFELYQGKEFEEGFLNKEGVGSGEGFLDKEESVGSRDGLLNEKKSVRDVESAANKRPGERDCKIGATQVFGVSGALFIVSREVLDEIAYDINGRKEYFDETIFLYKEDVDLTYRIRLAGYKNYIINNALAYHDRSISEREGFFAGRRKKSMAVRGEYNINVWSYYHHHIILYKLFLRDFSLSVKLQTLAYELAFFTYLLVFEFSTLKNSIKLFRENKEKIKLRKSLTKINIKASDIEHWMK